MNQGLEVIGSATQFGSYVDGVYRGTVLPLLASTTGTVYCWVLDKYLMPTFGDAMLRDLDTMTLQKYFSGLGKNHATAMKVKDALGSVLSSALRFGLLSKNPLNGVQIPSPRVGKRTKPHITPEQFDALVNLVAEPYATMIYTCVMAGLRISELVGLKWEDIHADSLTVDERFSRGEWGCPKTSASSATIGVDERVVERINRLKDMEVTINWGARGARKTFKLVRSATPRDLVFQSLVKQGPMSDHNVLSDTSNLRLGSSGSDGSIGSIAPFVCDLAGRSGRRSESGASADEAQPVINHHGHLCAVRSRLTAACGLADDGYGDFSTRQSDTGERIGQLISGFNCDVNGTY